MFVTSDGAVDQLVVIGREARRRVLVSICEQQARLAQRLTQVVREADDHGDWRAAGCSSSAQWLAQLSQIDHRTAMRVTRTADALRSLPELDRALGTGALSLDQVAAAAEFATPASDGELAALAVGRAPSEIALVARAIDPPRAADDQELYRRRALSMSWTGGRRELCISGRLPLEQGAAFEEAIWSVAKQQRAADKRETGSVDGWQQSAADALVTLTTRPGGGGGRARRSPTTLIVHVSDDAPPILEGAGPISAETAERLACDARRLTIKPTGRDLVHSRVGRCASYAQKRALHRRSSCCQYPGCTAARELEAHHVVPAELGGRTELANLILLCPRHHKLLHDHHIHTSGTAEEPDFQDENGRTINANQPHAPPT